LTILQGTPREWSWEKIYTLTKGAATGEFAVKPELRTVEKEELAKQPHLDVCRVSRQRLLPGCPKPGLKQGSVAAFILQC
jgi:hypothetical protein